MALLNNYFKRIEPNFDEQDKSVLPKASGIAKGGPGRAQTIPNVCCTLSMRL